MVWHLVLGRSACTQRMPCQHYYWRDQRQLMCLCPRLGLVTTALTLLPAIVVLARSIEIRAQECRPSGETKATRHRHGRSAKRGPTGSARGQ